VHAIAGTHVVLFGFDVPKAKIKNLAGFALKRTGTKPRRAGFYLDNFLLLEANDVGADPDHSSHLNPFQEFVWGDYTLDPGSEYEYLVEARYGKPGALSTGASLKIAVRTESETGDAQDVFFNLGVAGSQAYARRFTPRGASRPDPPAKAGARAWTFLSRGLAEAMQGFIAQANGPRFALRAAVYEFECGAMLQAFGAASKAGADVQIVYDAVRNASKSQKDDSPRVANEAAIDAAGIRPLCTPRTHTTIAHNKFVVLLEDGAPVAVWTGSTNFTEGGIYGQWNGGHIVRDAAVAARYLELFRELKQDEVPKATRVFIGAQTPLPKTVKPPKGITLVFSPRSGLVALDWYAKLMDNATDSVFLTAAFGVSKELTAIFAEPKPYLRYLLLDKLQGDVTTIARSPSNRITSGGYFGASGTPYSNWMHEALSGLNTWVQYVHTKIMLIDPLGNDPIVITGSANFSEASTTSNDENMLVIRGDTRIADIYLGEFMRVFSHFRFRGHTKAPPTHPAPGPGTPKAALAPVTRARGKLYLYDSDAWARPYFVKDSPRAKERLLFRAT
jgi:phosphatidylserine/phosphatidylglycerophosphate/cardiolipin synthase-like enzyme